MARQNDHKRAEDLISAYLDKRVSAEERAFFERHIASCTHCRAQLETTRSMVAALKAMPAVKAPRSFVLPREMAKQPQRSFLSLYPALRLATVVAALAFVVLFAGDLLIIQSGGGAAPQSIPAAAPAPLEMAMPEAARQLAPTQDTAAPQAYSDTATAPAEQPAPAAGAAAKASATAVMTEATTTMASAPTATPEATAVADAANQAQMMLSATPEPSGAVLDQQAEAAPEQPAVANVVEAAPTPTIDPLRVIEIALLVSAVVLGVATLIARRKQAQ
jgi:predicted anti-sigma-YlaC factor YlaD